jgi:hypothetical protein
MKVGPGLWSRLMVVGAVVGLLTAAPVGAQEAQQGAQQAQEAEIGATPTPLEAQPAQPRAPSPALLSGPSLRETGRIGTMPSSAPVNLIEPEAQLTSRDEKSIAPAATALEEAEAPARRPVGVIDKRVLEREITERFATIDDCRVEVARSHQVLPTAVTAVTLLLRWTIERDGTTSGTEVVATSAVDMAVMDCAKQVMSQWTFTRPRGGPVSIERKFLFKPLRER